MTIDYNTIILFMESTYRLVTVHVRLPSNVADSDRFDLADL